MHAAWRYYIGRYREHYRPLLVTVVVSLGQFALVLPLIFLVQYIFDKVIPTGNIKMLILVAAGIFLLNLANGGVSLWIRYTTLETTKIVIRDIRSDLLARLYVLSRSYYGNADRGELHDTIVQDTERLDVMSNALVAQLLPSALVSCALFGVLIYLNWVLFLIMITVAPFLYLVNRVMGKKVRLKVNAFRRSFEAFSKGMLFVMQAMDLTRLQTAEDFETERQKQRLEELRVTSGSMAWLDTAYGLVQHNLSAISSILILVVGGAAVARKAMSLGELLSFYVTVGMLQQYTRTMLSAMPKVIAGNESLLGLYELLRTKEVIPYTGAKRIPFEGRIRFESVHFRYTDKPVLEGIELAIEPGTTVAIVGPNGSGKSTMIHLICGFYRPQGGLVRADDHPYDELDVAHLRRSIGVVMQEPFLFLGTILENITYGSPQARMEEVIEAAELATAHAFIRQLPLGYDTPIGEGGILLSGGQRQRIAIARALLRRPKLLIFDEPTNHLDTDAVGQLMANLRAMAHALTTIMISHDPEVVCHAQHVYGLENGRALPLQDARAFFARTATAVRQPGAAGLLGLG
jgi:ATP-binding cassette subfamily B protein